MKTIVVNLFGAPGCGKSTNVARIFAMLKDLGIDCELVTEFAKDLVWEDRHATLDDELYIFAKQNHRLHRLNGKVRVIITDAPLYLKLFYMPEELDFSDLVLKVAGQYENMNYVLNRVKPYNPKGRLQTEEEVRENDGKIVELLKNNDIEFDKVDGSEDGCKEIIEDILFELEMDDKL